MPQDIGDEIGLRRRQHVLGVRAGSLVHDVALAVVDAVDPAQVDALALVGEDLVALDVLEERHIAPADRGGEPGVELAVDAHLVREVDDVVHSFHLSDLHGRDVAREKQRLSRGDHAHADVVEVVRRVAVEVGELVLQHCRERDLVVAQRGLVDVRLERGSRLALGGDHVELAANGVVAVVGRTDPCEHLTRLRVGSQQGSIVDVGPVVKVAHALRHRLLRQRLQVEVERGVDDKTALLDRGRAEHRLELRQHEVHEVRRLALARAHPYVQLLLDVFGGRRAGLALT